MDANYAVFQQLDTDKYVGKWIAIVDEKVVASGENFADVYSVAKKKYPSKVPFIAPVTSNKVFIL